METTIYESRARELLAEIRKYIDAKGMDLDAAWTEAGFGEKSIGEILESESLPTLPEFIALCQISGIAFHIPAIETPNTAM